MSQDDPRGGSPAGRGRPTEATPEFVAAVMSRLSRTTPPPASPPPGPGYRKLFASGSVTLVAAIVVAFVLFGGEGEAAIASLTGDAVPIYACPGEGQLGTLRNGERVELIGRSGEWVAIRDNNGRLDRIFVHGDFIDYDGTLDDLGDAPCDPAAILGPVAETTTTAGGGLATSEATTTTGPESTSSTTPDSTTTVSGGSVAPTNTTTTVWGSSISSSSSSSVTSNPGSTSTSTPGSSASSSPTTTSTTTSTTTTTTTTSTTTTTTAPTTTTTEATTTTTEAPTTTGP